MIYECLLVLVDMYFDRDLGSNYCDSLFFFFFLEG